MCVLAATFTPSLAYGSPFLFGITNGGNIRQIDIATKNSSLVFTQSLAGFAQPNALAYDFVGQNLYYRSSSSGDLFRYNITTNTQTNILAGLTIARNADNAAFFANSYWFVQANTQTLVRISNLGGTNTIATFGLGAVAGTQLNFGDIAVTSGGILYGHTTNSQFFSANISALTVAPSGGNATGFRIDSTGNQASLQIAFSPDPLNSTLYAHNFASTTANDKWYTIDYTSPGVAFGDATAITGWQDGELYRDIAGSSFQPVPAPPAAISVGIGGLVGLVGTGVNRVRRRRRATSAKIN